MTTHKVILTSREFRRETAMVDSLLQTGKSITVTRYGDEYFDVIPKIGARKGLAKQDFSDLQFSDPNGDRNLSKKIDEITYGI